MKVFAEHINNEVPCIGRVHMVEMALPSPAKEGESRTRVRVGEAEDGLDVRLGDADAGVV